MVITVNTNAKVPLNEPPVQGTPAVVRNTLSRLSQLQQKKAPWLDQYQLLGEFIHMIKQEFQEEHMVGEFLTREIFDSKGPASAQTSASTLIGLTWPQTKNRIKITAPGFLEDVTGDEKKYYEFVTQTILRVMDDPKAGFITATDEYMKDQVVFGTSGVEIVKDKDTKVRYTPWGVEHMFIEEGKNRDVDTVYLLVDSTTQKLVKDYGIDNVSDKTRKEFNEGKFDINKQLVIAIEPRITKVQGKDGNKNKPFSSVHIEKGQNHLLRESGFDEMPIIVNRFFKNLGETYGRSFGMNALPDILMSNAMWESIIVAVEKSLDPPAGVYSDGVLGGGEIDTSAGAINVFNPSDQAKDRQPYFQLFTIGEFKQIVALIQVIDDRIADHFAIDRLLDFNNQTRMTATEATLRDRMRNQTLGSILNRQLGKYFIPCIERTFNILLESDELGVNAGSPKDDGTTQIIPPRVAKLLADRKDVFDIQFFTPAMRIIQSDEADGMLRTQEFAGRYFELGRTDALDSFNIDKQIEIFSNSVGAPSEGFLAPKEIQGIRDTRDKEAQDAKTAEEALVIGETMRNVGQSGLVETANGE